MSEKPDDDAWLARPDSVRLLWRVFWAILALIVLAQFVIKVKGYFVIDAWPAFGAVFGFLSCLAMVLVAKGLGVFLKRKDDYYQAEDGDE